MQISNAEDGMGSPTTYTRKKLHLSFCASFPFAMIKYCQRSSSEKVFVSAHSSNLQSTIMVLRARHQDLKITGHAASTIWDQSIGLGHFFHFIQSRSPALRRGLPAVDRSILHQIISLKRDSLKS